MGRHRKPSRPPIWPAVIVGAGLAAVVAYRPVPVAPVEIVAATAKPAVLKNVSAPQTRVVTAAKVTPQRMLTVVGRQGLTPKARNVLDYVDRNFPAVKLVGGVRPDPIPDHPSGRGLDIMVPSLAVGDAVFADLMAHKADLNIRYMLWRVPQHHDHIHVCVVA